MQVNLSMKYDEILEYVGKVLNRDFVFSQKNNLVLKILFYVPYGAHSRNPDRIAITNILNYFFHSHDLLKHFYMHTPVDDENLFSRISLLYNVPDGDACVIKKGRLFLELIMLQDYFADRFEDSKKGKYNPFVNGKWDYMVLREKLISSIKSLQSLEMDKVIPFDLVKNQNFWRL